MNCTSPECDYGQASPLGRKTPYDRRLTPVAPSPGKPKVTPKDIKVKPLPPADASKPKVEPTPEHAGIAAAPLPLSNSNDLSTLGSIDLNSLSQSDHSPEFLDQLQRMELARQLEQESRIKATMDLRKLRGDDDDKDQDAIRALEEIEMDKINLNKLKIAK